jgi:hypothetical protein
VVSDGFRVAEAGVSHNSYRSPVIWLAFLRYSTSLVAGERGLPLCLPQSKQKQLPDLLQLDPGPAALHHAQAGRVSGIVTKMVRKTELVHFNELQSIVKPLPFRQHRSE